MNRYRHCPHEEDAEGFVHAISTWMDSSQNRDSEVQFAETSDAAVAVADESSRTLL